MYKIKNTARGGGKSNANKSQAKKNKEKECYNKKYIRMKEAQLENKLKSTFSS
jgi:hypothetical protein